MKQKSSKIFMWMLILGATVFSACEKADTESLVNVPDVTSALGMATNLSVANLTIDPNMDFTAINAVLNAASSGDIVNVQAGTYEITGKLAVKPGITIQYSGSSSKPVFKAPAARTELLELYYTGQEINTVVFTGIEFQNIRFKLADAKDIRFENCVFSKGKRKPQTDKKYLKDAYVEFLRTTDCIVNLCEFKRENSTDSGRGIYNKKSVSNQFTNNSFEGYFTSAINENSTGTRILKNTINRELNWVNTAQTDHGIYAHTFEDLQIVDNTVTGWPADGSGGAVKARNGKNLLIENNEFVTSGILLYVYDHATHPFLENVRILNNTIDIATNGQGLYYGIGYWRNTTNGYEKSILIKENQLPNGSIYIKFADLNTTNFNLNGGGIYINDIGNMYLKPGISESGNY